MPGSAQSIATNAVVGAAAAALGGYVLQGAVGARASEATTSCLEGQLGLEPMTLRDCRYQRVH